MSNAFQVVIAFEEILAFHEKALKNVFFIYLTHRKQTKGSEEEWKRKYIHFTTSSSFAIIMLIANGGVHFPNTNACFSNWHGVVVHWFMYKSC